MLWVGKPKTLYRYVLQREDLRTPIYTHGGAEVFLEDRYTWHLVLYWYLHLVLYWYLHLVLYWYLVCQQTKDIY